MVWECKRKERAGERGENGNFVEAGDQQEKRDGGNLSRICRFRKDEIENCRGKIHSASGKN